MSDIGDLRERLVGQRFYDREQEESFTVVGITSRPSLALLQYDDGVAWDEVSSNFAVSEEVAQHAGLDEDGLDSERYRPLGPGPRIDQICEPGDHEWHPWPGTIWPGGPSEEARERIPGNARDYYSRIARCKQCGLSGDVAGQFGPYGSDGRHEAPWFCFECGEAHAGPDLVYVGDFPHCPDCRAQKDEGLKD